MLFRQHQQEITKPQQRQSGIFGPNGLVTAQDLFTQKTPIEDSTDKPLLHDPVEFRTIFMSDLHFGTRSSAAGEALQFFNHVKSDTLDFAYLVGDIFDLINLNISRKTGLGEIIAFFDQQKNEAQHNSETRQPRPWLTQNEINFLQKVPRAARKGTKVVYIPGNHDEPMRDLSDIKVSPHIIIKFETVHKTIDGKHYLVMHGDSFDEAVRSKWLEYFGTHAFEHVARLSVKIDRMRKNARINHLFEKFGFENHWSLAEAIKETTDGMDDRYRRAMRSHLFAENAEICRRHKRNPQNFPEVYLDGIIGGHTHVAARETFTSPIDQETGQPIGPAEVTYLNSGHWTSRAKDHTTETVVPLTSKRKNPTFTAVVEYMDGRMGHVQWLPGKGIVPLVFTSENDVTPHPISNLQPAQPSKVFSSAARQASALQIDG